MALLLRWMSVVEMLSEIFSLLYMHLFVVYSMLLIFILLSSRLWKTHQQGQLLVTLQ